jgi:hypothetical protein
MMPAVRQYPGLGAIGITQFRAADNSAWDG